MAEHPNVRWIRAHPDTVYGRHYDAVLHAYGAGKAEAYATGNVWISAMCVLDELVAESGDPPLDTRAVIAAFRVLGGRGVIDKLALGGGDARAVLPGVLAQVAHCATALAQ